MFWGLIMEPNKRYTQTVEKPFHISQAAMDTSTGDSEVCQVMVVVDGKNFLICTLQKNKTIQVPLDLYFKTGNVISFLTNGKCNVHLTGYLDPEYDEDDEDDEEDEEEDEAPELVPTKNKRKLDSSTESATKKLKQETKKQMKKQLDSSQDSDEEDDDSSDDEGADDLQKLLAGDVDSDENDESFRPNSTGGDSEEESGEEEEVEEEAEAEEEDTTLEETDTSKQEEPAQLSRSAKRKLKKLKKQQELQQQQQPQTNGVEKKKKKEQQQPEKKQKVAKDGSGDNKQATPDKKLSKTLSGGVQIEDLKVGGGAVASAGKEVEVYYEGRLKQNNKMFDNCKKGAGFRFRVGHKEVITGWDVGIAGMKVGGKRKIVCPPSMAYGAKGSPPVIPPNSTLVFEVELRKVK